MIFLKKLKELGEIPEGDILCTIDVVGLYPHIPHEELGLESMAAIIEEFIHKGEKLKSKLDKDDLVGLAKYSIFWKIITLSLMKRFTDREYNKVCAGFCLYVCWKERKKLSESELKPLVWWRLLDHVFLTREESLI